MSSVKKNFVYNIMYQILVMIIPLITAPYLSRVVGEGGIGVYTYSQAYAQYFVLAAMLGVNNYGNRAIARVRDDRKELSRNFCGIYAFQVLTSVIALCIYLLYVRFFVAGNQSVYYMQAFYVASAGLDINWFFFGLEKFKMTVFRNTLIKILTTISIFLFVKGPEDVVLYTFIIAGGTVISQMALWPFVKRYVDFKMPEWSEIRRHIKPNLVLFVPVVAISLYNVMDKIMLGAIGKNTDEVGFYSYSESLINMTISLVTALGTVMLPRASNLMAKGDMEKVRREFDHSMQFVAWASCAMAVGMGTVAGVFAPWYFGAHFTRCGLLLSWLSPIIIFKSWACIIRTQYIIPAGRDNIYIISVVSGAVVNLIANFLLIPHLQGVGAVIGTILAEFSVCLVQTWMTGKEMSYKKSLRDGGAFLLAAGIMGVCIHQLERLAMPALPTMILQVFSGILIYVILTMIYLRGICQDDYLWNSAVKVLKKRGNKNGK